MDQVSLGISKQRRPGWGSRMLLRVLQVPVLTSCLCNAEFTACCTGGRQYFWQAQHGGCSSAYLVSDAAAA